MNTIKRFSPLALFSAFALVMSMLAAPVHAATGMNTAAGADQVLHANDHDKDRDDRRDDRRDDQRDDRRGDGMGTGTGTGTGTDGRGGQGGTGQPGW
ncbi:hypothetical protein [Alcanivorax quisquiliarum]|uniref:Uncharacterized protein n=1 Tax=Alcanivorax quisquiliarum TaxID=2933565 RepID=A0ABT0E361_9GAMM|nr:hypothetical protein [Alcanivorax quisquiliarum]MCK0536129.1 hypothetical protein [Alcanivorax quisquiliarum]